MSIKKWSLPGTRAENGMLRTCFDEVTCCPLKVWAVNVAVVYPSGRLISLPTKTYTAFKNSLCGKWRVKWAIGYAPLSSTVAGLIELTSKPEVPWM